MNEEIVQKIAEQQGTAEVASKSETSATTWLVFSILQKRYAVRSSDVLEIIRDVSVYKLPFLPSYIEGVLNRRGDPFTVINPCTLLNGEETPPPKESLFMIFKRTDDQLSIHISDILFFTELAESDLNMIPDKNEGSFFLGTLPVGTDEIPALNPNAFELLIRKDLESQ